jgi:hypothetical protein
MRYLIAILAMTLFAHPTFAADQDPAMNDAIADTQRMLQDKSARDAQIKKDPHAQKADQDVSAAVGGSKEGSDKVYQMSAEILPMLSKQANGDPDKMAKLLEEAQKNPEKFYNSLSPELKDKVRDLANEKK